MTPNYFTPLRYPGGKGKLAEYIKEIVIKNSLTGGVYVEPYAGGAAVAIELLILSYVDEIHINDLNRGVHAFWSSVLNETDDLIVIDPSANKVRLLFKEPNYDADRTSFTGPTREGDLAAAQEMLSDPDMKEMAQEEIETAKADIDRLDKELTIALLPKDPNDERNIFLEIRAGTGGDEASLFVGDLLGMYVRYCNKKGWKTAIVSRKLWNRYLGY